MFGVSGNDIKTALEVPAIGNIGDKQRLWNKHRDKMMMVQKVARLYGKATGDGRAIAVDKAITLTDTLLVDKGNGSKVQSLVNLSDRLGGGTVGRGNGKLKEAKAASFSLKQDRTDSRFDGVELKETSFVNKGDNTGLDWAKMSVAANDSKRASDKASVFYLDKLSRDRRTFSNTRVMNFKAKPISTGKYDVEVIVDNVDKPQDYFQKLISKTNVLSVNMEHEKELRDKYDKYIKQAMKVGYSLEEANKNVANKLIREKYDSKAVTKIFEEKMPKPVISPQVGKATMVEKTAKHIVRKNDEWER